MHVHLVSSKGDYHVIVVLFSFVLHLQNWGYLQAFPEGPRMEAGDIAIRVQLRDANAGFIAAYH